MEHQFEEVIGSHERLRALHKPVGQRSAIKVIDHIDELCRRFIAACPFVIVATRGADGQFDLSPKGDPAGFVAALDDKTLAIPDRLGNNRLDTFENLLAHPEVGLIFLVPGHGDTLRISGKGRIVRDRALQDKLAVNGKPPNVVLVVTVEEVFMHCPKCVIRSSLWKQDTWPDRTNVPTIAEALVVHGELAESLADVQAHVQNSNTRLY
jgi:uncharacterized protein